MIIVGVTGHRVLAEREKVRAGIQRALAGVRAAFPDKPLAVLSALAEGADRLVAQEALAAGDARLIAVLPLPVNDYIADFATAASVDEFHDLLRSADEVIDLAPAPTRDDAYSQAGRYILDRSDVLLGVWDGEGAHGIGGTGEIVGLARARRLPFAWVMAGNRMPGTLEPTSLGSRQGEVRLENL